MKKLFFLVLLSLTGLMISGQNIGIDHWESVIYSNDIWRYFIGISEPDSGWRTVTFNDSAWAEGPGGFGYGDNDDSTVIGPTISVYIRRKFNVTDTSAVGAVLLQIDYDDAFVAYLNDVEIARVGLTGLHPSCNQIGADHEANMYRGGAPETFLIDKEALKGCLIQGENLLAIQVHNSSLTSSDMSAIPFLTFGITNTSNDYRALPSWFTPPDFSSSSKLPLIVINTPSGQTILDEPKITADMKIIFKGDATLNNVADSGNIYSGKAGIEIRGHYSAWLPQKPYGLETRDQSGANLNVALLGMPAENDWVLLANYNDKSFLRNFLAFDIWRKMGYYAPDTRYCEVILNNDYQGIYLFGEKIKRDRNRVNITKLDPLDNSGDNVTGGYIIKNDYYTASDSWISNFSPLNNPGAPVYFVFYDPKPGEITLTQKSYIRGFIYTLETVLYGNNFKDKSTGYRAYLDIKSFVDYFIIGEVTRNIDAYKKSRFYFKDRNSKNKLLNSGPVWDYDWAWKNIAEDCIHFNQTDGSGWAYKVNECNPDPVAPSWEVRMLQDPLFANLIHKRYFDLRKTILNESQINHTIDSVVNLLNEAQVRHFNKWKILGINVGTPEVDDQPVTFDGEILKLKTWINTRLAWLDANMVGSDSIGEDIFKDQDIYRIFPNPASENVYIESNVEISNIKVVNLTGITVAELTNCNDLSVSINVSSLTRGIYFVSILLKDGKIIKGRLVKN